MEATTITDLTEQCEKEKGEILAEQVTEASDCTAEQDQIKQLKAKIASQDIMMQEQ